MDRETKAQNAREILSRCHVARGENFDTLSASTVESLLEFADIEKYRKPRNANGSRGRYYHDRLQRLARGE